MHRQASRMDTKLALSSGAPCLIPLSAGRDCCSRLDDHLFHHATLRTGAGCLREKRTLNLDIIADSTGYLLLAFATL